MKSLKILNFILLIMNSEAFTALQSTGIPTTAIQQGQTAENFSTNASLLIRATEKALDYANSIFGAKLNEKIRTAKINSFSEDFDGGKLLVNDAFVENFHAPLYTYNIRAPNQFTWGLSGADVTVKGTWDGYKKVWFVNITGAGKFAASAKSAKAKITAELQKDQNHRPAIKSVNCEVELDSFQIQIDGGFIGWILNLFSGIIAKKLRPIVQDAICNQIRERIDVQLAGELQKIPLLMALPGGYVLSYSLISDPEIGKNFLQIPSKGEIRHKSDAKIPEFFPSKVKIGPGDEKMLYFWSSDYLLNSGLWQIWRRGELQKSVNQQTEGIGSFFRSKCDGRLQCIGDILKDAAIAFPDAKFQIIVNATEAPKSIVKVHGIELIFNGNVDVMATFGNRSKAADVKLGLIKINATLLLHPYVDADRIRANVSVQSVAMKVVESHASVNGVLNDEVMNFLKEIVIIPDIQNYAQTYLTNGYRIPMPQNFRIVSPKIDLREHTIELSTDVLYSA